MILLEAAIFGAGSFIFLFVFCELGQVYFDRSKLNIDFESRSFWT